MLSATSKPSTTEASNEPAPATDSSRGVDRAYPLLFGDDRVSERRPAVDVLIVGLGGVGGFAAELIARAGIGRMTIVDADIVQPSISIASS